MLGMVPVTGRASDHYRWQDETWLCWLQQEQAEDHALQALRELVHEVWQD